MGIQTPELMEYIPLSTACESGFLVFNNSAFLKSHCTTALSKAMLWKMPSASGGRMRSPGPFTVREGAAYY